MQTRNYQPSDYQSVKAILIEADMFDEVWDSEEHLAKKIKVDPESIIVAEDNGEIIGQVFIIRDHWACFIYRLAVKESARNSGIGSALVEASELQLKNQGIDEVALYVDGEKNNLKEFYKNRGYSEGNASYKCMWKKLQSELNSEG